VGQKKPSPGRRKRAAEDDAVSIYRCPLAIASLFVLFAGCAKQSASPLPATPAQPARSAHAGGAVVWTQSDGFKVRPFDAPIAKNRAAAISGARNETTAFQIVVSAKSALAGVNVALSDLGDGKGHTISAASSVQLYREFYVNLTHKSDPAGAIGEFPDGLVPIGLDPYYHERRNGAPFDVAAGRNQAVWVDVAIPAGATPGTYRGTASVTAGGAALASVPVTLTVWKFALPATASLTTAFGLDTWGTYQGHYGLNPVWNTGKIVQLTNLYQTEALKNRISLYDNDVAGPYYTYSKTKHEITMIDYGLFDRTMNPDLNGTLLPDGARGTVAEIPNGNPNPPGASAGPQDEEYVAYWKAVSAHFQASGWSGRDFYYDIDEPSSDADYATAAHRADVLHQADPSLRAMVTTKLDKRLIGHINIWTPIVNELDTPGDPPPSAYAARQKLGEKVWFYHSDSSVAHGQWPDFFVDRGMNNTRIFAWMAWRYGLDGFLYYATTQTYTEYPNPWTNVYSFGDNGDGILFYPGRPSLIGGKHDIPCSSIRLKTIRAAMQDYEYMEILHGLGQDAFVNSVVQSLVKKTNNWSHDGAALLAARQQLARKIESL
jgi:hypothetical protein